MKDKKQILEELKINLEIVKTKMQSEVPLTAVFGTASIIMGSVLMLSELDPDFEKYQWMMDVAGSILAASGAALPAFCAVHEINNGKREEMDNKVATLKLEKTNLQNNKM